MDRCADTVLDELRIEVDMHIGCLVGLELGTGFVIRTIDKNNFKGELNKCIEVLIGIRYGRRVGK